MFDQSCNQPRQQTEQNGRWYSLAKAASDVIADVLDFAVVTGVPAAPLGCVLVQVMLKLIPERRPRRQKRR